MVKTKHTVSIEPELWELAKSGGANVSELVEQSITLRYGAIKTVMEGASYCFKCKKRIVKDEVTREFVPTNVNTIWIMTKCKKCYDKLIQYRTENNIENPELAVTLEYFLRFMKDVNDKPEALRLISVAEKGLVICSSKNKFIDILNEE